MCFKTEPLLTEVCLILQFYILCIVECLSHSRWLTLNYTHPPTLPCCHKALQDVHQILNFRSLEENWNRNQKFQGVEVVTQMQAEAQKLYSFSGKSDCLSEPWFSFYLKLFSCKEWSLGNYYGLDFVCLCHCPSPPTQNIYILNPHSQCFRMWLHLEVGSLKRCVRAKSLHSCPTLCDPMDCSLPGSSVHGIFQARLLEWVAVSFSRGSSWPRDRTQVSLTAGRLFTFWALPIV